MTISIGIVGKKELNQNNKQKICIDGQWYFGGNTDVSNLSVGQRIEFEWNTFGDNGKLRGLQSWGLTPEQPTLAEIEQAKAAAEPKAKWAGKPGGGGFGRGQDRGLEIDLQCMRFVGQTVAALIEKSPSPIPGQIGKWATEAFEAIKFARSWGATAPAPANSPAATSAGQPSQTPPRSDPPQRVRPTGNFGWGTKYKETPWNVLTMASLVWFRDDSNAPAEIKAKCRDEIFFRDLDGQRAKALAPQTGPTTEPDFDDDIPF